MFARARRERRRSWRACAWAASSAMLRKRSSSVADAVRTGEGRADVRMAEWWWWCWCWDWDWGWGVAADEEPEVDEWSSAGEGRAGSVRRAMSELPRVSNATGGPRELSILRRG